MSPDVLFQRGLLLAIGLGVAVLSTHSDSGATVPRAERGSAIRVGRNARVSAAHPDRAHVEVLAAVHPHRPELLLACAMVEAPRPSMRSWATIAYRSADGGETWTPVLEVPGGEFGSADPACAFTARDQAYFVSIANPSMSTLVYVSSDAGQTWRQGAVVPIRDRPYVLADDSGADPRVYVHGLELRDRTETEPLPNGVAVYAAARDGASFTGGTVARPPADQRVTEIGNSVVLSDRTVAFVWAALQGPLPVRPEQPNVWWHLSRRSGDGSAWPSKVIVPAVSRGSSRLTMGFPSLAVDQSDSPFRDRLYLVWTDFRDGYSRILFSYSSDRGDTWTQPRIVDESSEACSRCRAYDNILPSPAVSSNGVVGLLWYDRRDSSDGVGFTPRIAVSFDGGDTFSPSRPLSAQPASHHGATWPLSIGLSAGGGHFAPAARGGNIRLRLSPQHWPGDTASLLAGPNGSFRAFWVDNRTGAWQLWTAAVGVAGEAIRGGIRELAGMEDITSTVAVRLGRRFVDRPTSHVTMEAQLFNTSTHVLQSPLAVKALWLHSDSGPIQAVNPDIPGGRAPVWMFHAGDGQASIPPGGSSAVRTLIFRLGEAPRMSASAVERNQADIVELELKVLGRLGS